MLASVFRDLRYAGRSLAQAPAFTSVAVLALALGIGANSAIFTVVNSVLLQPLHFDKPEQLVWINERNVKQGFPVFSVSPGNYLDYHDHNRSFAHFAAWRGGGMNLSGIAEAERLQGAFVTQEFFDVFNVKPLVGRTFISAEMQPGANHEAVLGYALWQRRFGGR